MSDTTTATVHITALIEPTALYCRYPGEIEAQPCHISLNLRTGELTAGYRGAIGGSVPVDVHHRIIREWAIPPLTADSANALMETIRPLAQRVQDGGTVEWQGEYHAGALDDDAQAASDEIADIAEEWADESGIDVVSAINAADWYSQGDDPADEWRLTADTPDEVITEIEATAGAEIRSIAEGTVVVEGLRSYIEQRRDEMRAAVREALEDVAEQIDVLVEKRAALVRQVDAWGTDSDRQIAALAGKSHTWVQNVVRAASE